MSQFVFSFQSSPDVESYKFFIALYSGDKEGAEDVKRDGITDNEGFMDGITDNEGFIDDENPSEVDIEGFKVEKTKVSESSTLNIIIAVTKPIVIIMITVT